MRRKLQALERNFRFTRRSRQVFEELLGRLGVASTQEISLPISDQPFWFRAGHPLANYQSTPTLPESVDVLIIGAGLTGASAAYHLGPACAIATCTSPSSIAPIPPPKPADATAATSS